MAEQGLISWQTVEGETTVISGYTVTPQSQALRLRLPFGGFVWNRPLAVNVEKDGVVEMIPIVDATRIAQIAIYAFAALLTLLLIRANRSRK